MTNQNAHEGDPLPTGTAERGPHVDDAPKPDEKSIQFEAHRIGVEAVARALDQSA